MHELVIPLWIHLSNVVEVYNRSQCCHTWSYSLACPFRFRLSVHLHPLRREKPLGTTTYKGYTQGYVMFYASLNRDIERVGTIFFTHIHIDINTFPLAPYSSKVKTCMPLLFGVHFPIWVRHAVLIMIYSSRTSSNQGSIVFLNSYRTNQDFVWEESKLHIRLTEQMVLEPVQCFFQ